MRFALSFALLFALIISVGFNVRSTEQLHTVAAHKSEGPPDILCFDRDVRVTSGDDWKVCRPFRFQD